MLVRGDKREQINAQQFYLDQDLTINGAQSIISANASAKIRTIEAMAAEAKVTYKVVYKIIYKDDNGLACFEESFEHTTSVKAAFIEPSTYLDLNASVIAVDYVGINNLKLRCSIEIKGHAIIEQSFMLPDSIDNVNKKLSPIVVESINPIKQSEIIAFANFDLKETIDKLLTSDAQIIINKVATATEICEIKGECYVYLTYLSNGNLASRILTVPFNSEVLAPQVKEDSVAYMSALQDSITVNMLNDSGEIKVEIVISVKGFCINKQQTEFITDVYSTTKELSIGYKENYVEDNVCLTDYSEKISASVRLGAERKRIRSVLCVCPPTVGAISVTNSAGLVAEGIVSVSVVYLNEDEHIENELVEIPYHFLLQKDFACQNNLYARANVSSITARARHNDEIEVNGEITIEVYGKTERLIKYIASVEEINDLESTNCAITMYPVKKGQALWDVAKALLTDEQTLLALNPNVKLPLVGGEKIVIYRKA